MRSSIFWLALPVGLVSMALASAQDKPAAKKLYCWNENGQRVCSDALPAEAVTRAREEINAASGLRTAEVDRALTEEERAQAEAAKIQAQLDEAAQETRRRTEQAMLLSYRSEEELRRVFNERIAIVDNNIKTARYNVVSLREGLVSLLQVAGDRELAGQTVAAETTANIRSRHADLMRQRQLQASFERQRAELDVEIAEIMQRYREMKGPNPASAAPATGSSPAAAPPDA
ncbi:MULTISPECIES: hypothetical protein [unclassified Pseudoxanthomonas]|uniref:hypothetical protein n=1 Tax=unclassified Pseudoxanthomonas TaxID=2645906 RepID=UPI001608CFDB|nr:MULTISPECIES: hypothetical protein [unclassified Pseudoxanthomonas]MBB3276016.1 hypothetical protein [Pseudoxanthomonas sp. OG2]MBD9379363.1 hypothetical protein [Pseudoxanthomonas sp. PXM04]MBV7472903.1 hypothetical protein [Pseudoxanthomonas sp. PXM05]